MVLIHANGSSIRLRIDEFRHRESSGLTGSPGEPARARDETAEDTMATTHGNASSNLPGKPPVVDLATWRAAREELLVREKAHTREGDAIAAARRRLPMVELDGAVEVTGVDGPVLFLGLLDMTPYGRGEAWEDNPEGWPVIGDAREGHPSEGRQACWYWRSDADGVATWGPTSRPVPQWTRSGATPVETLGRKGHHH